SDSKMALLWSSAPQPQESSGAGMARGSLDAARWAGRPTARAVAARGMGSDGGRREIGEEADAEADADAEGEGEADVGPEEAAGGSKPQPHSPSPSAPST